MVTRRSPQYVVVVRSANIVDIDGPRFLIGSKREDNAPISHPSPIRSLVTAAQHRDITEDPPPFRGVPRQLGDALGQGFDDAPSPL